MMTEDIIQRENEILNKVVEILKKYISPNKIILFGSRAKQRFCRHSDFDIAVDKEKLDIRTERTINEEIEKISGLYKVDIVFLNSVDNSFKNIILKTGEIIYERRD